MRFKISSARLSIRGLVAALAATVILCGCGGGGDNTTSPGAPETQTPPPTKTDAVAMLTAGEPRLYLTQGQIALADLDPTIANEQGLSVTRASGPAMQVRIGDGNVLYFLGPVEQFADTTTVLALQGGSKPRNISFNWSSKVGIAKSRITEPNEAGLFAPDDNVDLIASNLPDSGVIVPGAKLPSFTLTNAKPIDATIAQITLGSRAGDTLITEWFSFDPTTQTFTLLPSREQDFLTAVRTANRATLSFSLSTAQYAETYGFEQSLVYANGTINVRLVNADGAPAKEFAGVSFVARGFNGGYSAVAQANDNGEFSLTGLPADSYDVTQVLLDKGMRLTGFSTLTSSSAVATLTITKTAGATPGSPVKFLSSTSVILANTDRPRELQLQTPRFLAESVVTTPGAYGATATSDPVDTLVTTPVQFTAPKGSGLVGIKVSVSSEEFPVYTGAQSIYNDLWTFDLQIPATGARYTKTGKVNQTHSAAGTITIDNCVDLTSAAKNTEVQITGILGSQNVADAQLPTVVTVTISPTCDGGLSVTKFAGSGSTPEGLFALWPRKTSTAGDGNGNLAGQYLSIPVKAQLPINFGIPATLNYAPVDVTLTEIELFQRTAAGDVSLGKDYLSQGKLLTPGTIQFAALRMNPTALAPVSGQVQIVAVARGTANGTAVASAPTPLTVNSFTDFTPLYLTSEIAGYSESNRYGTRDAGGDSWSTAAMMSWVFGSGLRYNDISGANVKQSEAPNYRSILGHNGHSDGQQVDVRYYDEEGKFTGALNGESDGAAIAALGQRARAEVVAKAQLHPNLDKLVAWIAQNRTNIGAYAGKGEVRRIYIGNQFVANMLIAGEFSGTPALPIPEVGKWTKSAKISPQPEHLHHWHISTTNP